MSKNTTKKSIPYSEEALKYFQETNDNTEFMTEFNTTHPEIEIPDPVKDDIDNDYDLPYTPPQFE